MFFVIVVVVCVVVVVVVGSVHRAFAGRPALCVEPQSPVTPRLGGGSK